MLEDADSCVPQSQVRLSASCDLVLAFQRHRFFLLLLHTAALLQLQPRPRARLLTIDQLEFSFGIRQVTRPLLPALPVHFVHTSALE